MTSAAIFQEEDLRASFGELARRGVFKPINRYLTRTVDAEDRAAEGVASAWRTYRRCALEKGKLLGPGALVQHAKWRACDLGRRLVSDGTTAKNRDAMSQLAFQNGEVEVLRIDGVEETAESSGAAPLDDGLAKALSQNPERRLRSAIDLSRWLDELSDDDRVALADRMSGEDLRTIGAKLGVSTPTACRRLYELGHLLAQRAGIVVDDGKQRRRQKRR